VEDRRLTIRSETWQGDKGGSRGQVFNTSADRAETGIKHKGEKATVKYYTTQSMVQTQQIEDDIANLAAKVGHQDQESW
jgi:hypothetical protein